METKGKGILGRSNIQRSRARKSLTGGQKIMELSITEDWNSKKMQSKKKGKSKQGSHRKEPSVPCQQECVFSKNPCLFFH